MAEVRQFETGATRDQDANKYDYEGFYSPLVVERFAEYMHKHRHQVDGKLRASDNWQKGIPKTAYMKSLWRHVVDVWKMHRGLPGSDTLEDALCAILFNAQGYLFEILKEKSARVPDSWDCGGVSVRYDQNARKIVPVDAAPKETALTQHWGYGGSLPGLSSSPTEFINSDPLY